MPHHRDMERIDQRQFPRRRVKLAALVARSAAATAVIDLSEGGAALDWRLPDDIAVGETVELHFLLAADQSIDLKARVVRIDRGRAGVVFLDDQRSIVQQLLAEAQSSD
jgi:hypothetical protein